MKTLTSLIRNLPAETYERLDEAVEDILVNKKGNRIQRRRLQRRWEKVHIKDK